MRSWIYLYFWQWRFTCVRNKDTVNGTRRRNGDTIHDSIDRIAQKLEARDECDIEFSARELRAKDGGMIDHDRSRPSVNEWPRVKVLYATDSQPLRRLDGPFPNTSGASQFGSDRLRAVERCDLRGINAAIMAVALCRFTPGLPNGVFERCHSLLLRSSRPRHVENLLLQDGAVQIVHAIAERNLREWQTHAHPISGEMVDVIEVNPADSEVSKLFESGGRFDVR